MRRFLLFLALLVAPISYAQTTTVTATVIDANSNPYAFGTVSAQTVAASGRATTSTTPSALDSVGSFSIILPSPSTYVFTLCSAPVNIGPLANSTPQQICFPSSPITVSGTFLDISSVVNPLAKIIGPKLNASSTGCVPGGGGNFVLKNTGAGCVNSTMSDDGTTPSIAPNGLDTGFNGNYIERIVDIGGVTANKLVCRSSISKAVICPTGASVTVLGVAQATVAAGGTAKICWAAGCQVVAFNNFTAGHWLIPSTSVAGDVDDTGSAVQPATGVQIFLAENSGTGGSLVSTNILSPDTLNAASIGFTNPMTILGDIIVENSTPAATRLPGPTAPNNVLQNFTSTPSGGVAQLGAWKLGGVPINAQTGTTYTVAATDRAARVTFSNAGAIAVTLPQAGSGGGGNSDFTNNFVWLACDIGAGTATITPTTSTINGAATLILSTGFCAFIYSDNTNYFATRLGNVLQCSPGIGDGLNAIPAGTYLQFNCVNRSGVTWTIVGVNCWTDNAGTSTLNLANNAATGLLTGAVTCNNTKSGGGAAGTQSGTVTLATNDAISFTFVADGTSKQTTWTVILTQ